LFDFAPNILLMAFSSLFHDESGHQAKQEGNQILIQVGATVRHAGARRASEKAQCQPIARRLAKLAIAYLSKK